jgi:hypothetical protein
LDLAVIVGPIPIQHLGEEGHENLRSSVVLRSKFIQQELVAQLKGLLSRMLVGRAVVGTA